MTFRTRGWERVPALAGELCPNLLFRAEVAHSGPMRWALVSTVLHWPSDTLPPSHPAHGTAYGERVEALRKSLPATYVLVESVHERPGRAIRDDLVLDESQPMESYTLWVALPKTSEVTLLGRAVDPVRYPREWEVGVWPEPLDWREGGGEVS